MMNNNYKNLIARIDDLLYQNVNHNKNVSTNFLNQEELVSVRNYLGNKYLYKIDGGYENAEYCKVIFLKNKKDDFSDVVCLVAPYDKRFINITHRDILGALMDLSINRNSVGDFWVEEDRIILYTTDLFSKFIIENFISISKLNVKFEISEINIAKEIKTEVFEKIISSNRLDNIVSAICNCSRSIASKMIEDELVKVNHVVIAQTSKLCNNSCVISIRGHGRFLYKGVLKTTKKDKILVQIEKFI